MMKALLIFLSALMIAGFEAVGLEDFGSPQDLASGPSTIQEWNDHAAGNTDTSKKRRKKKRRKKKSSKRGGGGAFDEGVKVVSLGYGAPNLTKALFSVWQVNEDFKLTGIGPAHAKFEYGLSDRFGLGLSLNFVTATVRWTELDFFGLGETFFEGFDYMSLAANVRANYYFVNSDAFSAYVGMGLGYNYADYTYYSDYEDSTPLTLTVGGLFGFEASVGARYFFTDNIGAYVELGYSKSLVQGGLSIKF